MVALQVQGFCLILAIFPAPIIPRIGFYGLKYKAFSIIQDTLTTTALRDMRYLFAGIERVIDTFQVPILIWYTVSISLMKN